MTANYPPSEIAGPMTREKDWLSFVLLMLTVLGMALVALAQ